MRGDTEDLNRGRLFMDRADAAVDGFMENIRRPPPQWLTGSLTTALAIIAMVAWIATR